MGACNNGLMELEKESVRLSSFDTANILEYRRETRRES